MTGCTNNGIVVIILKQKKFRLLFSNAIVLLPMYVNLRLNQSLQVYYKEVVDSFNYLKYKNELRLARKLNKYERNR